MDLRLMLAIALAAVLAFVVVQHSEMMEQMAPMGPAQRQIETEHERHHEDTETTEADVHTVRMVTEEGEFHFEPHVVRVEPGDTVRWVLESGSHSATSYDPSNGKPLRIPENADGWTSGVLRESGATFAKTFQIEGVYDYFCVPHEGVGMVGTVVVGEAHDGPGLTEPQSALPSAAREQIRELNGSAQGPQGESETDHHE